MDKTATPAPDSAPADTNAAATPVRPVRSAKDAINAMYAENSDTSLSDYLAISAQEIINSNNKSKSAANLHSHSSTKSRLRARPSASGMLRTAKVEQTPIVHDLSNAMDPLAQKTAPIETRRVIEQPPTPRPTPAVIQTSLKLAPKKAAARPQTIQPRTRAQRPSLNGTKGPTTLTKLWAARRAETRAQSSTTETLQALQQAVQQTTGDATRRKPNQPKTNPPSATKSNTSQPNPTKPSTAQPRTSRARRAPGLMQDVVRTPRNVDGFSRRTPRPSANLNDQDAPDLSSADSTSQPTSHAASTSQPASRPLDSIKRRFKTAPKGYVATPEVQPETYESFTDSQTRPPKPPVEIYGMMEEDYTVSADGLGVVEDYNPTGDKVSTGISEQKVAQGSGTAAPDNNKYALGGQSPFFLKSVNVEKRPLSDGPRQSASKSSTSSEGTLYERPDTRPVGGKNLYPKKETKKSLPTKPTVIIPAARKSKAPFIFLLILTIILGAAVGAFAYLCFFQYLD